MHDAPRRLHETLRSTGAGKLEVVIGGRYSADKGQDFPAHYHNHLELLIYTSGHIECVVGAITPPAQRVQTAYATHEVRWSGSSTQVFTSRPGLIQVMPAGVVHADRALTAYSHCYVVLRSPPDAPSVTAPFCFMDDPDHSFEQVITGISSEWRSDGEHRERMLELLVAQLEILCLRLRSRVAPNESETLVRNAERLLEERYMQSPGIAQIASELGVSPSSLRSHFAAQREYSPKGYLQRVRLKRTLEIIRTSSLSLDEIAALMGYDSASHLSRHVKAATGLTPGQFRAGGP